MVAAVFSMKYEPSVVCLSFFIAFLGSYLTITFCYLLRMLQKGDFQFKVMNKSSVIIAMACALGGIGIWSMHFVGMSSLELYDPQGVRVLVKFRLFPTLLSFLFVLLFSGAGLYVASLDSIFGKSKEQIIEICVKEASKMTMYEIKHTSTLKMMFIISTHSLHHLVLGGVISGSGISVMHYLGMWGMMFDNGEIYWNIGVVSASILIAIIASIAAFWILFRFLSLYPHMEVLRIASSFIMAVAVCGMHYTGMVAATFESELGDTPSVIISSLRYAVKDNQAYYIVLLTAVVLGSILVMMAFMELRHWIHVMSVEHKNCTKLLEQVAGDSYENMSAMTRSPTLKKVPSKLLSPRSSGVVLPSVGSSVHHLNQSPVVSRTHSFGASNPQLHVSELDV